MTHTSGEPPLVRVATDSDLPAVAAIYDNEVETGISTFDLVSPGPDYWEHRLDSLEPGDHLFVAELGGVVVGYAYSSSYRPRPAYHLTRETSVYLAQDVRGRGIGWLLYDRLLKAMTADGIHMAVALVALPNRASVALHERCGFEHLGTMREVGRKFDRWVDTAWYQKELAP